MKKLVLITVILSLELQYSFKRISEYSSPLQNIEHFLWRSQLLRLVEDNLQSPNL